MSIRYQGTVVSFMKAYGFMFCTELGRRVFFHVTDLNSPDPNIGDVLEFELAPSRSPEKPDQAVNIHPATNAGVDALAGGV